MYYKISDRVLFRPYNGYGYLADNSEYGYRFLRNDYRDPGEKYVSESGSVMLSMLSRKPRAIEEIISELLQIFEDVDIEELKRDTEEFYDGLVAEGFLDSGVSADCCIRRESNTSSKEVTLSDAYSGAQIRQSDFLRAIHIEVASECNERCIHCYIPHEEKLTLIKPDLFYRIVEDGRRMNIIHVTLSGGEPLLHPDMIPFLKYCHDMDLSVNVLSNLLLLDDNIIDEMRKNPLLSVQTSIYSMNPHVHDEITGIHGSLKKTKRAVQDLILAGIPVQISCPVMKENKDTFLDVVKWGDHNNIGTAIQPQIFAQYDHTGRNLTHRLSAYEISEVVQKMLESGYGDQWIPNSKEVISRRPKDPVCSICRYLLCVSATGVVYPCVGWQTNEINTIDHKSLREIWLNSEKISALRQIQWNKFPKCINCEDKEYCTVCMMSNSNENSDGDPFRINPYFCETAKAIHYVVDQYQAKRTRGNENEREDTNQRCI